jgi:hypothetical protein
MREIAARRKKKSGGQCPSCIMQGGHGPPVMFVANPFDQKLY